MIEADELCDRLVELGTYLDGDPERVQEYNTIKLWVLYLWCSTLYYHDDCSPVLDQTYDRICRELHGRDDSVLQRRPWFAPRLFDREALKAGSGFHIQRNDPPIKVQRAAHEYLTRSP